MINDDKQLCSRKSNDIIQNYFWKLSKTELKMFEYLCCCVDTYHYDKDENTITTSFQEMQKEFGSSNLLAGGTQYLQLKKLIQQLADKSAMIDCNGNGGIIKILAEAEWQNNSQVKIFMTNSFKKFATNLDKKKGYTFTELQIINSMTSKYTIQFYYLIQSWAGKNEVVFDIDYLRKKLQVPVSSYSNVGKFIQILDKCILEYKEVMSRFNKLDNKISYEMIKQGKKYVAIKIMLHNSINIDDVSWNYNYKTKPNELNFDNDDEKEQYIDEWLQHKYDSDDVEEKYSMLYKCIPEQVHEFDENRANAIFSVAIEYANVICRDAYAPDIICKCEIIINRFNNRKWFTNYNQKAKSDIFAYYLKCFECWCKEQRKKVLDK